MYKIEMSLVFSRIIREDEDVVDVHPYKNPQVVLKDIIHDALERGWHITEARGHNDPLEGTKSCVEGGFLNIFLVHSDLNERMYLGLFLLLERDRNRPLLSPL